MNREDLLNARKHAVNMEAHYLKELEEEKPHMLPCGCPAPPSPPAPAWKTELSERSAREFRATVEAIDLALKSLEAADEA